MSILKIIQVQDPDITELSLNTQNDDFLANIFLSKDGNGKKYISDENISKAVEEVIKEINPTDAYKNAGLIYILRVIIYVANVNDVNDVNVVNGSSLPNEELQKYIDNWHKPSGGKKTRKYKKRKTHRGKTRRGKTRRSKTRRGKTRRSRR